MEGGPNGTTMLNRIALKRYRMIMKKFQNDNKIINQYKGN
jgi:hypothetical protein